MNLTELLNLPLYKLLIAMESNDPRWFDVLNHHKELCPDFEGWLKKNKLERTPANALNYLSEQYDIFYGERDRKELAQSTKVVHQEIYKLEFHALLEKQITKNKHHSYEGELCSGHFIGIKKHANIDPSTIKNHTLALIKSAVKTPDGVIKSFIVNDEKGNSFNVPIENTYRIY